MWALVSVFGVGRRLGEGRRLITAGREEAEGKGYAVDAVVHSRRVSKGRGRKKGEAATGCGTASPLLIGGLLELLDGEAVPLAVSEGIGLEVLRGDVRGRGSSADRRLRSPPEDSPHRPWC